MSSDMKNPNPSPRPVWSTLDSRMSHHIPGAVAGAARSTSRPAVGKGAASGVRPVAGHGTGLPGCVGLLPGPSLGVLFTGAVLVPGPLVEPGRLPHLVEEGAWSNPALAFDLHLDPLGPGRQVLRRAVALRGDRQKTC